MIKVLEVQVISRKTAPTLCRAPLESCPAHGARWGCRRWCVDVTGPPQCGPCLPQPSQTPPRTHCGPACTHDHQHEGCGPSQSGPCQIDILIVKSINRSIVISINRSIVKSLNRSFVKSINKSIVKSINRLIVKYINRLIVKSIHRSIVKYINRSIVKSINRSIVKSINRSIVKWIYQNIQKILWKSFKLIDHRLVVKSQGHVNKSSEKDQSLESFKLPTLS